MGQRRSLKVFLATFLIIFMMGISIEVFSQVINSLRATNTAQLVVDNNNNGLADGGDVIQYTVQIANCSGTSIGGVNYQSDLDPNTSLVPNSVQVTTSGTGLCGDTSTPPIDPPTPTPPPPPVNADAVDDAFAVTNGGNIAQNVLTNDTGEAPLTVVSFGDSLANVGTTPADGVTVLSLPAGGGTIDITINATGAITITSVGTTGSGSVTLFYQISSNNGTIDNAQITVNFGDFPVVVDDLTYTTIITNPLTVLATDPNDLLDNDLLGSPPATLTFFGGGDASGAATTPAGGTLTFGTGSLTVNADGSFTFTANAGFTGDFDFQYTISNGLGTSTGNVTIQVQTGPIAQNDANLIATVGTITNFPAPTLFNDNGSGADSLGVPASTLTNFGAGNITGSVAVTDFASGATTGAGTFAGGTLTVNADGSFSINNPTTPGIYTFDYRIQNVVGISGATVTVDIRQGPIAEDDAFTMLVTAILNGDLTANNGSGADFDGIPPYNALTFGAGSLGGTITSNNAGASVPLAGGTLTINLDGTFSLANPTIAGVYTFQYRLSNTIPASDDATVTITIQQAPVARNDANLIAVVGTVTNFPAPTLFNDNGSGADNLGTPTATLVNFGGGSLGGAVTDNVAGATTGAGTFAGGTLTVNGDGSFNVSTPTANGVFTFQYRIQNVAGFSDATVTITIQEIPIAQDDTFNTGYTQDVSGYSISGNLTANNGAGVDVLGLPPATITSLTGGITGTAPLTQAFAGGSITVNADGTFTLTNADSGTYTFTYTLDNGVGTDTALVTFIVDETITVSATTPATGAVNVPLNSDVVITFDEAPTLNGSWFTIVCGATNITTANSVVGLVGNVATINPTPVLPNNTLCTVTVLSNATNGVTDADANDAPDLLDGDNNGLTGDNFVFTFTTVDDAPPQVVTTVPANLASGVATDTNITITFDENVDIATGGITLDCGGLIPFTPALPTTATPTIVIDPTPLLPANLTCTVTLIATNITDQDGLPDQLDGDNNGAGGDNYVFTFVTDAPPAVIATSPVNGATNAVTTANISVVFSEPVNADNTSFTLVCNAVNIPLTAGEVTGTGTVNIIINPTADLPSGVGCTVTVVALNVTDVDAGDPPDNMTADFVFSFSTDAPPTVTNTAPTNGATGIATTNNIVIDFSENVDIGAGGITVDCGAGAVSFAPALPLLNTPTITINPDVNLPAGTLCTVTVLASGITDSDLNDPPNNMVADYVFSFTTDAAPAVTTTTPTNGATGVASNTNIVVNFSEPVTASNTSFTIACPTGSPIALAPADVTGSGTATITINPSVNLTANTTCTVTVIATQISDVDAGDPPDNMLANFVFSFDVPPVANDDAYTVTPHLTFNSPVGVRANDDPATVTIASFGASLPTSIIPNGTNGIVAGGAGGTVVMNADGTFIFYPEAGDNNASGVVTFFYTITGGDTAQVTLTYEAEEFVWFVDSTPTAPASPFACSAPYTGTQACPSADLATVTALDTTNDAIFIDSGSYTCGITLEADQIVIGNGSSSTLSALLATRVTPVAGSNFAPYDAINGTDPTLTSAVADCFTLATGNTIQGLTIGDTGNFAGITGTVYGTFTVSESTINGTGQIMNLDTGTVNATFDSLASTSSDNSFATLRVATSTVNFVVTGGTTITGTPASVESILLTQNTGTGFSFGNTSVNKTTAGRGVVLGNGTIQSIPVTFGALDITTSAGTALETNRQTGLVTSTSGTINATNGAAINMINAVGNTTPLAMTLTSTSSTSSIAGGILLSGASGTLSAGGGALNTFGDTIRVLNSSVAFTYNGSATHNTAGSYVVNIDVLTGAGAVTLNGTTTANNLSQGISIQSSTRPVTFDTVRLGTSLAPFTFTPLLLANNTGAVALGDVDIFTNNANGLVINYGNASPGLVSSTDGNIFSTGNATALLINHSTQQPINLVFENILAPGVGSHAVNINRATGIFTVTFRVDAGAKTTAGIEITNSNILTTTIREFDAVGATVGALLSSNSASSFTITGDGNSATHTNGAGGTMSNIVNEAYLLTNVSNITLNDVFVNGTGSYGIRGTGVANITMDNLDLLNIGNASGEHAIYFGTPLTTNISGIFTLSDSSINGFAHHGVVIENTSGAVTVNITTSQFQNNVTPNACSGANCGGSAVVMTANGTSSIDAFIQTNTFDRIDDAAIRGNVIGASSPVLTVDALDNIITGNGYLSGNADNGNAGIILSGTGIGTVNFDIDNNQFSDLEGSPSGVIFIGIFDRVLGNGAITDNIIRDAHIGSGITTIASVTALGDNATLNVLVSRNEMPADATNFISQNAIFARSGGTGGTATVNITIENNVLQEVPTTANVDVIWTRVIDASVMCVDIRNNNVVDGSGIGAALFVQRLNTATMRLEGVFTSGPTGDANATTLLNSTNTLTGGALVNTTNTITSFGNCTLPSYP